MTKNLKDLRRKYLDANNSLKNFINSVFDFHLFSLITPISLQSFNNKSFIIGKFRCVAIFKFIWQVFEDYVSKIIRICSCNSFCNSRCSLTIPKSRRESCVMGEHTYVKRTKYSSYERHLEFQYRYSNMCLNVTTIADYFTNNMLIVINRNNAKAK